MRTLLAAAMAVALVLAGCAHDVMTRFPAPPGPDSTGSLVILFGEPASNVLITIDGWLVVTDEHTARVVIDAVPIGTRDVVVSANGVDKPFRIWVAGDHATTVPIGVPDGSVGFWKTIAGTIITLLVYSWLKV
jgi:hypothetical protein|nr:hypothetical protein [Kofleriaceae bacterium]